MLKPVAQPLEDSPLVTLARVVAEGRAVSARARAASTRGGWLQAGLELAAWRRELARVLGPALRACETEPDLAIVEGAVDLLGARRRGGGSRLPPCGSAGGACVTLDGAMRRALRAYARRDDPELRLALEDALRALGEPSDGSGKAPDALEERLRRLREEHPPPLMPPPAAGAPAPPRPFSEVEDDEGDGSEGG